MMPVSNSVDVGRFRELNEAYVLKANVFQSLLDQSKRGTRVCDAIDESVPRSSSQEKADKRALIQQLMQAAINVRDAGISAQDAASREGMTFELLHPLGLVEALIKSAPQS
jgi:hypothetical protein